MDPSSREEKTNSFPQEAAGPRLWGKHTVASIVVAAVLLLVLASSVDLAGVWRELVACDKGLLALAALSHYGTYPVRGVRWRRSLNHVPHRCGNAGFGLLVFFYNFVDNVVPAKLGDIYASHLARINCGVRRSAALGSIVFLRMIDAWLVLILAAAGAGSLFETALPRSVAWALMIAFVIAVATTAVVIFFIALKKTLPARVPETLRQRISAFHSGMLPDRSEIVSVLFLTLIIWTMETMWLFLLARAFRVNLDAGQALFLTMIPMIVTAFPLTPSGAGAVELTLYSCLRLVGVSTPLAASLTVVNRFIDFWLHLILGAFIWTFRRTIGLRTWRDSSDSGGHPRAAAIIEKETAR